MTTRKSDGMLNERLNAYAGGNHTVREMLWLSVGRVIRKTMADDSRLVYAQISVHDRAVRHVADWFKSAVIENAPWLKNVDQRGRIKKLMKFGTLEQIFAEADKVMIRKSRGLGRRPLGDGHEEVVATLEDGYSIVRLLTPEALDAESHEMQHCVGHGAYDECLEGGSKTMLLSLRDRNGRAHATAEITDGQIIQVQGKQNTSPAHKYLVLLVRYFAKEKFNFGDFCDGVDGWVADIHGVVHSCDQLPRCLHVPGDLHLHGALAPAEIEAKGNVYIAVLDGETPPRSIKAGGDIHLYGRGFRELPEIQTAGELRLEHTSVSCLPNGLRVKGLRVEGTPLKRLPDDISIYGDIALHMTKVTSLPPGLWHRDGGVARSVGTVDLTGSPVCSLGGLNDVNGSLLLGSTAISKLPERLDVANHLDISMTSIRDIPIGLKVGGNLTIMNADVRFRQEELAVGGGINIRYSKVKLPRRVVCGKTFKAFDAILAMPEHIQCGHDVSIENTKLNRFPKGIFARSVWLENLSPSCFLNRLSSLDCTLWANQLTVKDKPLRLGAGVRVDTVVVFEDAKRAVSMTTEQARAYLDKHKSYARRGGLAAFAESISATVRERGSRNGEVLFFTGLDASLGRVMVYDEFQRSAA